MPLVSVVVPMFNAEKYICDCIESVQNQSHSQWELLIVDDGSTDESFGVASRFAERDERIRLLSHPERANRGVSFSRQMGFEESRGEYIALLDADDLFEPHKLEKQLEAAKAQPDCVVFHSSARHINSEGEICGEPEWMNRFAKVERNYSFSEDKNFLHSNTIINSTALIRADALRGIRFGSPQLFQYEDWTLWVLLSSRGEFYVQPDMLVRYRVHDQSATSRVQQSKLVETYSHMEFLLSVLASTDERELAQHCLKVLESKLVDAVAHYGGREGRWQRRRIHQLFSGFDSSISGTSNSPGEKWLWRVFRRTA